MSIVLCMTIQVDLFAYEQVYPITAGVRWAVEHYELQSGPEKQKDLANRLPAGAPDFEKTFTEFEQNYKLYHSYNDSIFLDKDAYSEQWTNIFARRAECYASMYQRNNSNFDVILNWFKKGEAPESGYESLYYWTRHIYHNYIIDRGLMLELLEVLIPHYEAQNDTEHLVFCYLCAGYSTFQFARMGEAGAEERSIDFFQKAYDMGAAHFVDCKDPLNRYYTLAALTNLVIQYLQTGARTYEQSHALVTSFRKLNASPKVQALIRDDKHLNDFSHWALEMYEMRSIVIYINRRLNDPKLFDRLYERYNARRAEMGDLRLLDHYYYARLDYDDLLVEAARDNITWDEALKRFYSQMAKDAPNYEIKEIHNFTINNLNNMFASFCQIVDHTSMSQTKKKTAVVEMLHKFVEVIGKVDNIHFPIEKGYIISNIATSETVLKYLDEEEKTALIYRLMLLEQPVTYVHVNMVKELAMAITQHMIDRNASYFVGMPGLESEADVRQKSDSLLHCVEQGALYHDLGKIFIPAIVSQSYRHLIDEEFALIKLHPERSMQFFDKYPAISAYRDFALGHHKWYNGGGYPTSFDNKHSPSFQLINIVTIADCLDAATEYFERNYRRPKSFEEVISEFEMQSGSRYDPRIVNAIIESSSLYHDLEQMVRLGRFQLFLELSLKIKQGSL